MLTLQIRGSPFILQGGGSIFEINNLGQSLPEVNNIFQELFYINMQSAAEPG